MDCHAVVNFVQIKSQPGFPFDNAFERGEDKAAQLINCVVKDEDFYFVLFTNAQFYGNVFIV